MKLQWIWVDLRPRSVCFEAVPLRLVESVAGQNARWRPRLSNMGGYGYRVPQIEKICNIFGLDSPARPRTPPSPSLKPLFRLGRLDNTGAYGYIAKILRRFGSSE
jgi:hypothetical protein